MEWKRRNPRLSPDALMGLKESPVSADPLGCYTGVPVDPYEVPVQDADDL